MDAALLFGQALRACPTPMTLSRCSDGRLIEASEGFCRLAGRPRPQLLGRRAADLDLWLDPRQRDRLQQAIAADGQARALEVRLRGAGGGLHTHRISATRVDGDAAGPLLLLVGHEVDAAPRPRTADAGEDEGPCRGRRLRELSAIVEQTSDAIMLTGTDGRIQYVNPGFERLTGYRRDEVLGRTPAMFRSDQHDENFYRQLWETISSGKSFHAQVVNRRKDGSLYHAVKTITPMFDEAGRMVSFVNIDKDFTLAHEAQRRALRSAMHDHLTGLPSRQLFAEQVGQAIARHQRDGLPFSLLFIDLDGFKAVNDRLGHQAGDELLRELARRLRASLRSQDVVARFGGDEFIVLLPGTVQAAAVPPLAQALIQRLGEEVQLASGSRCRVGASVGISRFPGDGDNVEALLRRADEAMYRAKRDGGGRLCQASPAGAGA